MAIVTLTTDLGARDPYAGAIKGALLKNHPEITLVDITHQIEPFNVLQGAYVLRQAFAQFPENTIHLLLVNGYGSKEVSALVARFCSHWFVAPDNGLLPLLWEGAPAGEVYRVDPGLLELSDLKVTMPELTAAALQLAKGNDPSRFARPAAHIRELHFGMPVHGPDLLRGQIIHVDHFGNCIVNIRKEDFDRIARGRSFTVHFKRYDELHRLSSHYGSVEQGHMLCFFNTGGYLEIAINRGHAAKLLNLQVRDGVQITFDG
ncbi:MAG: SAM-dependent chlorinase/fluorinase [Chitinophagales bacterium]|nr:SAM-dependent chlorinase/fluorinase [Chitinophagales bacterium]MDW8392775.1 SAM-dependent chlorinase/fluorinase [Chitinophagales bacterium]